MIEFTQRVPGARAAGKADVKSPFDGTIVGTVEVGGEAAVAQALRSAHELYADRRQWLSAPERIAILERLVNLMRVERDDLVSLAVAEGGKPLRDTRVEVDRAIDGVRNCVDCLRTQHGREIPMGINQASVNRLAWTTHEPIGPVVAVSAFNHPLNLIVHQVAPAVATGCPVIVKPAGDTPLSCFRFVELLLEAGLPERWVQAIYLEDNDLATKLVTDPRVAFFSFIGSARVGWMLRGKLAPGTRCALEHGGAAPVVVAADADLDAMLPLLAKGGYYHAGQVCVSVQRVFAEQSVARELADRLAQLADGLVVGDPALEETEVGPLIRAAETERVGAWVDEAVDAGAELVTGGASLSSVTYRPTVLLDPPASATISRNEVFGPVVTVYSCPDLDSAFARANELPLAFQAAVMTRSLDTAMRAYRALNGSAILVNDHTAFRVDWMPFAGLRHSGYGIGGIPYTMHDMQVEKMLVIRSPEL